MKITHIKIENYKTYKSLDLDLNVTDERPIILVGGGNGCGKTTLFDAIYHALYGMEIKSAREFEEIFNAGVKNTVGMQGKNIILEISFSGKVLNMDTPYRLKRSFQLMDSKVVWGVELNMNGNRFVYGSGSTNSQRITNEEIVNKIIAANLPAELSNYFLFDAMKTSELVKEEQINRLIMKNINSVMGFNKYTSLKKVAENLLAEKKASRLENENMRKDYEQLQQTKQDRETLLQQKKDEYAQCLEYANENKELYEQLKEGKNADDITRDKIEKLSQSIKDFYKTEKTYRQDADNLTKELEVKVILPKLGALMKTEIEAIVAEKQRIEKEKGNILSDEQIENVTREVVKVLSEQFLEVASVNTNELAGKLKYRMRNGEGVSDKYAYLNDEDMSVLKELAHSAFANPFIALDESRERINIEIADMPKRKEQLEEYQHELNGSDYILLQRYDDNNKRIESLKSEIASLNEEIKQLGKKISTYDYDIPQIPDPQYDLLCKLPDFFKSLSAKLLAAKKASIEQRMKEELNVNLVVYAGVIGHVELSANNAQEIGFKIFHKNGNEIFLSQLNAGAKQTVMQVLLKVLYELGDYDPPVMIDTVMGVLDKESREVILEKYFPDLAHQTILLSTDTEITIERDFEKIQAYVAKTYTLHRDKEQQCTTVSDDYFGLTTYEG